MHERVGPELAAVRRRLYDYPALLGVFDHCVGELSARAELGLAVKGSLAEGPVDAYSDLDFLCVTRSADRSELRGWICEKVSAAGTLLTQFAATHLGLADLLIFFLLRGESVVKVDVDLVAVDQLRGGDSGVVLHDPQGYLASAASASPPGGNGVDLLDIDRKLCGWLWYGFTKVARGEILEALNAMEVMREAALVPCLRLLAGLPQKGFRHLEQELPPRRLEELQATYPVSQDAAAVLRSMYSLGQVYGRLRPALAGHLQGASHDARFDEMMDALRRAAREIGVVLP